MRKLQYSILAFLLAAAILFAGCISDKQKDGFPAEKETSFSYDNNIEFIYNCSSNGVISSGSVNHNMSYRIYDDGNYTYYGTLNVLKIDLPDPESGNESIKYGINLTTDEPGTALKAYIAEKLTLTKYYSESLSGGEEKKTAVEDSCAGYNIETGTTTVTVPAWQIIFDDSDIHLGHCEASYLKSGAESSNVLYSYWPVNITYNNEVEINNPFAPSGKSSFGNSSSGAEEVIVTLRNTGTINDWFSQYRDYYIIVTGEPESPYSCSSNETVSLKGHLTIKRLQ
ncbi:hypothetical protein [Methanoplanus endosymbiosus]|uniref:Lipoprotein n=1 Tax=Methanoplanus endosymbiosus TaxID=33865 RepID=A0A9E7PME4_9EURY|nr:hypothetical protein [Methanoplanus endosymbiosus]UUX91556.1 hypothetical protein L6E24_09255 [Methanoplanus endosymbiosus]